MTLTALFLFAGCNQGPGPVPEARDASPDEAAKLLMPAPYPIPPHPTPAPPAGGLSVSGPSFLDEGRSGWIELVWRGAPVRNPVTVTLSTSDATELKVATRKIVITSWNWMKVRKVRIDAVRDRIDDSDQPVTVTISTSCPTPSYALVRTHSLTVRDVDPTPIPAGVNLSVSSSVAEGGSGTITATLTTRPSSTVTLAFAVTEGNAWAMPSTVAILPSQWNVPVTATVNAPEDTAAEPPESFTLKTTTSSADAHYQGLVYTRTGSIGDNDCNTTYTGTGETCDGLDNNCNGLDDDGIRGTLSCPASSCAEVADAGGSDGLYYLNPDGQGVFATLCDGDWMLLATNPGGAPYDDEFDDDFNGGVSFGSASRTDAFISAAVNRASIRDLRFEGGDGVFAVYRDVAGGSTLTGYLNGVAPSCGDVSFSMAEGNLSTGNTHLCDLNLYIDPLDWDGKFCGHDTSSPDDGVGLCWSASANDTCPFDDPDDSCFPNGSPFAFPVSLWGG